MSDMTNNDYGAWVGQQLVDREGQKIGKIAQIYLETDTGQPTWATVKTGMFGNANSFVPLAGAQLIDDQLVSQWDKETVKGAPNIEDDGELQPEEEAALYRYYNMTSDLSSPAETRSSDDDAMTRSEEQVRVGTTTEEVGRVRLRKYVVTENVTQTVPVSHEEVRLERVPITAENRDAALQGEPISEAEHEVVLHQERPVVEKEVVPKERVRLATETVTDEAAVTEQVRKEQIEQVEDRPQT